ncbi:MAG TPA: transposase [Anaerolineales bacterium]|nr:transposase [Anaerolineales bacterium]
MKLIAQVKLLPTREQAAALRKTLEVANTACNYISDQAWENKTFRQFPLHQLTYRNTRETFQLSAQVVVRCVSKVADAYKIDRKTKRTFKPHGAIAFDNRILSYNLERKEISIWTVEGRQRMSFTAGKRQLELLSSQRGESDLCFVKGKFYLFVACDVETPKPIDVEGVLGVDLGIVNLASDSDGENFSGANIERNRRIFEHRRMNLQKKQTKSAKRKLKKLSGKQARFQKQTNHTISKKLVQKAQDTCRAIALEDLSGLRKVKVRRSQRNKHSNWSFYQLRQFIHYKAERAGVRVMLVDPRNTSRTCPECGYVDKANRLSQSLFSCVSCGFSAPADTVAAVNISARAVVNQPMVSADGLGTMPRPLAAG